MARKSRRAKAKHQARTARTVREGNSQLLRPIPAELQSATPASPKAQDLTSRYQYVMPEVKRIGIIAGSIVLVLIILSFILG